MGCIVHGVTKNQTGLSNFHFHKDDNNQDLICIFHILYEMLYLVEKYDSVWLVLLGQFLMKNLSVIKVKSRVSQQISGKQK